MGEHLIQRGAVGNHGGGQVAEIPGAEKTEGELSQRLRQADPACGAFPIGRQVQGGVLEIVQDQQQKQDGCRCTGVNPEAGCRIGAGLGELRAVVDNLDAFGVPAEQFAVDLTIARGLDYYTGTVYETMLPDHPEIGSVCSGGRYDNLAAYYIDRPLPGVGISIGLTRLFYVLGEQGMLNPALPTAPADVLVLPMTEDLKSAITLSTALRSAGIRTQLYTEAKKFKAKMSYADRLGIPYVIFLGEDEIAAGTVACKDMQSGEQTRLPLADTVARIQAGLREKNKGPVILE